MSTPTPTTPADDTPPTDDTTPTDGRPTLAELHAQWEQLAPVITDHLRELGHEA
ncbi:hypothetical protein [Streptomyces sp. URMC 129]|uniref:hypothetical protein n=1 Tax=Streptomyces sp. URMC 129 TaxID=3423407 RepID=UPI003F1AC8EF